MAPTVDADTESRFAEAERSLETVERVVGDVKRTLHVLGEMEATAKRARRGLLRPRNLVLLAVLAGATVGIVLVVRDRSPAAAEPDAREPDGR